MMNLKPFTGASRMSSIRNIASARALPAVPPPADFCNDIGQLCDGLAVTFVYKEQRGDVAVVGFDCVVERLQVSAGALGVGLQPRHPRFRAGEVFLHLSLPLARAGHLLFGLDLRV